MVIMGLMVYTEAALTIDMKSIDMTLKMRAGGAAEMRPWKSSLDHDRINHIPFLMY